MPHKHMVEGLEAMCQGQLPRERARSSPIIIAMGHSLTLPYKHMYTGSSFLQYIFAHFRIN
jgi:hypothetical protein